jgi:molybdopterin/thiamine biosynthesis adenylyltransferase/rhodanese-related sulfurtransferase/molybdopterin converting factor small subunit
MARVELSVPSSLRRFTRGEPRVAEEGETVGEVLARFAERDPTVRRQLFTNDGHLRPSVAVYVNDQDVRTLDRDRTSVREGDKVAIVPSLAGGLPADGAEPRLSGVPVPGIAAAPPLSADQIRRYSRHLLLPEVGTAGQARLRDASVLIVGAGGLGAPASLYLAAAGVGSLGLVDSDRVELSNLQRQVLYATRDVGRPKLEAAAERLRALNPDVEVRTHDARLDRTNAREILAGYDVILDGTDNFPTRYLVNDACVLLGKPDVYGSVYRFEGQASVFDARHGPCYRCLYAEPPPPGLVPSCAEGGVLGFLPGLVGLIQAAETAKLLLGAGETLVGRLLLFDALSMRFRELTVRRNAECVISGDHPTQTDLIDYPAFCGVVPEEDAGLAEYEIEPAALARALGGPDPPELVDVRQPGEWEIAHLPRARLIPLAQLPEHVSELARASDIVVYCKSGNRSLAAIAELRDLGFTKVRHLRGGIDAWADEVDPSLPRY